MIGIMSIFPVLSGLAGLQFSASSAFSGTGHPVTIQEALFQFISCISEIAKSDLISSHLQRIW